LTVSIIGNYLIISNITGNITGNYQLRFLTTRTKRYCSLVQYGLSHYQNRIANS